MNPNQNNSQSPQNENCTAWRAALQDLKATHTAYLHAYAECLAQKDFTPFKQKKDEFKEAITKLREAFPFNLEQKKQFRLLKKRFFKNPKRHREILNRSGIKLTPGKVWQQISAHLRKNPKLIDSLLQMEKTRGEPDAVWYDKEKDKYIFVDCS